MINQELERYILQSKAQGLGEDQIRQNLMSGGGWSSADLDQAFSLFKKGSISPASAVAGAATAGGKSSVAWIMVGIFALVLLGLGGYYYLGFSNNTNTASSEVSTESNPLNSEQKDLVTQNPEQISANSPSTTPTENNLLNSFVEEKDCGIALSDKEFEDRAGCMGLALATCSPAKMAQGPTSERLTITIKPEGNSCILSASSNVDVPDFELKTCKFSNSSLSTLRSEVLSLQKRINPSFKGDAMDESINTNIFLGIFEATLDEKALKSLQTGTISFSKMDVSCQ